MCDAMNGLRLLIPKLHLLRFVVDSLYNMLYNKLYDKSTINQSLQQMPTTEVNAPLIATRHMALYKCVFIIIIIIILFFIKKLTNATYDKIYKLQSL